MVSAFHLWALVTFFYFLFLMCVLPEEVESCLTSFDYRSFKIISIVLLSSVTFCHGKVPSLTGCLAHCTIPKAISGLLATCFSKDK